MNIKISSLLLGSLTYCLSLVGETGTNDFEKLAQSCSDMGVKIYQATDCDACVFSPYSIFSSIAMAYEGSEGDTTDELNEALSITVPKKDFASLANAWQSSLSKNNSLEVANALWIQNDFAILPSFEKTIEQDFQASLYALDLRNTENASSEINEWVKAKTHNLIPKFLDPSDLKDTTRLIAMSTLYFKDAWEKPFTPKSKAPFDTERGIAFVKMMAKVETCPYSDNEQFQMACFPFASGTTKLAVILPKTVEHLKAVEKDLSSENLQSWLAGLKDTPLYI